MDVNQLATETLAVRGGRRTEVGEAVTLPLHQTAKFARGGEHEYTRLSNPTVKALESAVAHLERLEHCVAFSSGTAAMAAVVNVLGRAGPVFTLDGGYAGTTRLIRLEAGTRNLRWVTVAPDLDRIAEAVEPESKGLLIVETPTNPFLRELSLAQLVDRVPRGVEIVVDNTMATPILQRPSKFGVRHVVHSASKFLNGHSDVIGGLVLTDDSACASSLFAHRMSYGACLDPAAAWLCLRGIKTLTVRMQRASQTASRLASWLGRQNGVAAVFYPCVGKPPGQMSSGGAVVTIELDGIADPEVFLDALRLITIAPSYGGVETSINQCAAMSHSSLSPEELRRLSLSNRVLRLSCGLESSDDLIADLEQAITCSI